MEGVLKIKMKKIILLVFFFVIFFVNSGFVNADILSFNSGGDNNIVINPDNYIEGFFSGIFQTSAPICGNHVIESGETCDDGNNIDGDGCSASCLVEQGGGGGGGTGGETNISVESSNPITVSPTNINLNLVTNTNREQLLYIKNTGNETLNVTIKQSNLDMMMIVPETLFVLGPGEIKEMRVIFVAPSKTGIFTGKIFVAGRTISVTLNVKSKILLFDSNIIVLNKDYLVRQGDKLRTSVTLIPMGDPERLDVTLNYVIKDYNGRMYLTRTETVLVEQQVNFRRDFDTGFLPLGEYIVGLELIYPNGVAPSSAHFEVISKGPTTLFGKIVFFLVNAILIVLILLIFMIILRLWKQIRRNSLIEKKHQEKLKQGFVPKEEKNKEKGKSDAPEPEGKNLKKQEE
jgi:cysteine-rich repeat protein